MNIPSMHFVSLLRSARLVLAGVLFAGLGVAAVSAEPGSLLPNGSFETANATGEWPEGWGRAKNVTWESEPGNYFLRLSSPAPGTHVSLYKKITLPGDLTMLELSFRVRVTGLVVGTEKWYDARVIMNFRDAAGKITTAKPTPYFNTDHDGWRIMVYQVAVPPGSVTLEFLPSIFRATSGVFDIDDIVLKPVAVAGAPAS